MPHGFCRAVLFILFTAASAEAQQIAGTFDQLRVLVKPGDTLTITESSGNRVRGKLSQLSASSMVLEVSGAFRQVQESDVDRIEKRGSDSLKNGALTGMAIGGGLAALAIASVSGDSAGYAVLGGLVYSGIGAGIGVGVDALIEGQRVIYAGSRPTPTFSVVPILSGRRKGVLLSVRLTR